MAATRIQLRRGTAEAWLTANPTLEAGELGLETDTGIIRAGTGSTPWVNLAPSAQAVVSPTAAEWFTRNPILGDGVVGVEGDTKQMKVGDGSTRWNSLEYTASSLFLTKQEAAVEYAAKTLDDGPKRQSVLMGTAMRRLRKGEAVKFVIRGDSTTYGHDTVSADRVAAPTTVLPDGTTHSFTRSPRPYPQAFGEHMRAVYGPNVTVENQGYSGDWVQRGFTRWTNNVNAHVTIISYGINDASASYVPEEYRGNVDLFVEWHEKMIIRDLSWGSAVVLLTSTKQLGISGNLDTDTFRNALYALATKYGIPVIDGEEFLANMGPDCWSDGNHLTTKGNGVMGARLTAPFVGEGPLAPRTLVSGDKLLPRRTLDGFVMTGNGRVITSGGYGTPVVDSSGNGFAFELGVTNVPAGEVSEGWGYFGFYAETPDLVLFPIDFINRSADTAADASILYELDFGVEQGDNVHDHVIDPAATVGQGYVPKAPSSISRTVPVSTNSYQRDPKSAGAVSIRVASAGWHVLAIRLRRTNTSNTVAATHAVEALDWRVWTNHRRIETVKNDLTTAISIAGAGVYSNPVPSAFNEANPIYQTKVHWPTLVAKAGIPSWGTEYYKAPVFKISVRSYGVGLIEYGFICTVNPSADGADIAAKVIGSANTSENTNTIPWAAQLGVTVTHASGTSPTSSINGREIESIGYEAATRSLLINWRTTNSADGTTAKAMGKNASMIFTPM